jgi:DNA sulfur modification protein DndD
MEVIDEAIAVSETAFATYRERMREAVQEFASDALIKIAAEPEFRILRIGQEYQISILNAEGVQQKHSTGYQQVSAMAFVAGLAQTAGERNLMAMDTPLGRLDKQNREGVLSWVASRNAQTILFVQSGELEEDEARSLIGKKLGRQLKIKRVRQGSSEIVEVKS